MWIEKLYQQTLKDFNNNLNLIFIKYDNLNLKILDKSINQDILEKYLKRQGYYENFVLGERIYVKGFTCIKIIDTTIEIWTDKCNNNKHLIINKEHITYLPIALKYFEK